MLAFSAVTQFPTNGSSTRGAGETVQASTSAEHVMIGETRKIRIASPELGTTHTFLVKLAPPPFAAALPQSLGTPKVSPTRESADMVKAVCHGVENYT
jgi:hypothetical protein